MAGVDPYSPCPCGSGQKLKWCCHKAEPYALRSIRLEEGNQSEASLEALDEGLKKVPHNPWLTLRKASLLGELGRVQELHDLLKAFLQKEPKHALGHLMYTGSRISLNPKEAADALQDALDAIPIGFNARFLRIIRQVALTLLEDDKIIAARRLFLLTRSLLDEIGPRDGDVEEFESMRAGITREVDTPDILPWMKQDYDPLPAPEGTPADAASRFAEAAELVARGRFRAAMGIYHTLTGELGVGTPAGGVAEYNEGLCRVYLGDHKGGVALLRRRVAALGDTPEAVDIELLCQAIEPTRPADRVEFVQWIWPVRNQEGLLAELRKQPDMAEVGVDSFDPGDANSAEAVVFELFDRPTLKDVPTAPLTIDRVPTLLGQLLVSKEHVALMGSDDGRLEGLRDRFMAIAGPTIVPAHPKTKVIDEQSRSSLAVTWQWFLPQDMPPAELERLRNEKKADILTRVWPNVPKPYLNGKTPAQAASLPEAQVPLRAALLSIAINGNDEGTRKVAEQLRESLKVPAEPTIDLKVTPLAGIPYARYHLIDLDTASIEQLAAILRTAELQFLPWTVEEAAERLLRASDAELDAVGQPRYRIHESLAVRFETQGENQKAREQIALAREADPDRLTPLGAMNWELADLMLRLTHERPEAWVPDLSVILERYSQNPECAKVLSMRLVAMRLIQMVPHPDRPDDFLLDTRRLQALLGLYGPKVRTASGELGVSAAKPAIWTPGAAAASSPAGGAGIWTPGSAPASTQGQGGGKSPLIIPGR